MGMAYVEDLSKTQVRLSGLILPALVGILPVLVPTAGVGLGLVKIVVNLVLLAMAAFVAYGRFPN